MSKTKITNNQVLIDTGGNVISSPNTQASLGPCPSGYRVVGLENHTVPRLSPSGKRPGTIESHIYRRDHLIARNLAVVAIVFARGAILGALKEKRKRN